jgi:hypothetical protein
MYTIGRGEYNRRHDYQMRLQNRENISNFIQELSRNLYNNRTILWNEINLRGRHPDNVTSDIIDTFSNLQNNVTSIIDIHRNNSN